MLDINIAKYNLAISKSKLKYHFTAQHPLLLVIWHPPHFNSNSRPFSTMSNPNTNALSLSNRQLNEFSSSLHTGMRIVHIGKDVQPINLPKMVSVNSLAWKKSASFNILSNTVTSLVDAHSVADIISLVSTELPLDTSAAF